jgi:hypothetical protein
VIKGAFGNPPLLRDRLDAGDAIAFGQEQLRGDVEDAFAEKCRRLARRPTAAARRRLAFASQRP